MNTNNLNERASLDNAGEMPEVIEKTENEYTASMEAKIVSVNRPINKIDSFFKECEEKGKRVKVCYYSPFSKQGFCVRLLDENGKPMIKVHPVTGTPQMSGSKYIYMEKDEDFEPIVLTRTAKMNALSIKQVISDEKGVYTSYQKQLIKTLELLSDDDRQEIVREMTHKKKVNPEAHDAEEKLRKLEAENEELRKSGNPQKVADAVSKAVEEVTLEAADEIKRLKDKYEKEISELTNKKPKKK
jgi:hypothetical protein